jgi:putative FmdB family regulatory protein
MPTYEYKCMLCNTYFTIKRSIDERDNEALCLACNNPSIRVINVAGMIFKGGGFYSTDKNDK